MGVTLPGWWGCFGEARGLVGPFFGECEGFVFGAAFLGVEDFAPPCALDEDVFDALGVMVCAYDVFVAVEGV
jgi:hypothetical protein